MLSNSFACSRRKRKTSDSCEMMRMTPPLVLPRRDFVEVALYAQVRVSTIYPDGTFKLRA